MNLPLDSEINNVIRTSARRLMDISIAPVRLALLRDVLVTDAKDKVLQRIESECAVYRPKLRLLRGIRNDGTWLVPKKYRERPLRPHERFQGWEYTAILKNLYKLLDYSTIRGEGRVDMVLNKILSWQTEQGYIPGDWTYAIPIPSRNGCVLHEVCRFGLAGNPKVERIAEWLLSIQRKDGGWITPYRQDLMYRSKYSDLGVEEFLDLIVKGGVGDYDPSKFASIPSCHWTTMFVLWGLSEDKRLSDSRAVKRGAEFLLGRFFQRNPHPGFWPEVSDWTKLDYPPFEGRGMTALDVLTKIGYGRNDERMSKPIEWLMRARSEDGFWRKWYKPYRESDQWITLSALRILKRYLRNQ